METLDWKAFLSKWAAELIQRERESGNTDIPREVIVSQWFGFPGATESQVRVAETRLGSRLPPSYRDFLKSTNGWKQIADWIPASAGHFLSVEAIDWFVAKHRSWVEAWTEDEPQGISDDDYFVYGIEQQSAYVRREYLQTALAISDRGDGAIYLLNPKVVTPDGEWEAWFFANWMPGASRYRSFREMMEVRYSRFLADPDDRNF